MLFRSNKDFSCLKGFCPSFVTVERGTLRKPEVPTIAAPQEEPPAPQLPGLDRPWGILVAGIGGTGVVTIGHILGMAAHIEGKGAALIDMVGISQKNGAVVTHLKIAAKPSDIAAVRVARGAADLILGCDLVTAGAARILAAASPRRTAAVVNGHETMPAQFTHEADFSLPARQLAARIAKAVNTARLFTVDATGLAVALFGDAMAANLFTLGYAWQKGLVPVGEGAILAAVKLNGVAVAMNVAAFQWGRRAAADEASVREPYAVLLFESSQQMMPTAMRPTRPLSPRDLMSVSKFATTLPTNGSDEPNKMPATTASAMSSNPISVICTKKRFTLS